MDGPQRRRFRDCQVEKEFRKSECPYKVKPIPSNPNVKHVKINDLFKSDEDIVPRLVEIDSGCKGKLISRSVIYS